MHGDEEIEKRGLLLYKLDVSTSSLREGVRRYELFYVVLVLSLVERIRYVCLFYRSK